MRRTTYRWLPERLANRLFPVAIAVLWILAWSSPPGVAIHAGMVQRLPAWSLLPLGLLVTTAVLTWGTIALFHTVDVTGKPEFIARRKLQQPFVDPLRPTVWQAATNILRNHLLLVVGVAATAGVLWLRGWDPTAPMGPWWSVLLNLVGMGLVAELAFFSTHRWLHTRWLYRHVHRVHHRFRAPTAWSAQYAHPFEYAVGNVLPLGLPMVLLAPDLLTIVLFAVLALLNTQLVHSGYALPAMPWAVPHDLHHYKVSVNYGSLGLMDRLFGSRMRRLPQGQDEPMFPAREVEDRVEGEERAAK